jgi:hypothetical protein
MPFIRQVAHCVFEQVERFASPGRGVLVDDRIRAAL